MILFQGTVCAIDIGFKDFGPEYYDPMTHDFSHTPDLCPIIRVKVPMGRRYADIEIKLTYKQAAEIKEGMNKIWENIEKGETTA